MLKITILIVFPCAYLMENGVWLIGLHLLGGICVTIKQDIAATLIYETTYLYSVCCSWLSVY